MADQSDKAPFQSQQELANALDEALDHIASAHRLVEAVRQSAKAAADGKMSPLTRDIGRVWNALDISGMLCTGVHQRLSPKQ